MIVILAILGLIVLGFLAIRYGYDSRDGIRSKEEQLAASGVTWDDLVDHSVVGLLARERRAQLLAERRRFAHPGPIGAPTSLRVGLARRLRALADRIDSPSQTVGNAHA